MNNLYFGDCLDILRKLFHEHPDGFIDLIYIDPPFNSKRNYNILFEEADLEDTKAQKEAFADTWSNVSYKDTIQELKDINIDLFSFLENLDRIRIPKGEVSYLTMMAIRIWYMHKVLKTTGCFYLHCDPTMSHYLKILCDMIFGQENFRNEIVWQRTNAHNMKAKYFGRVHDIIFFYSKSQQYFWKEQYTEYSEQQLSRFKTDDDGRLYKAENLTFSSANINRQFDWRGVKPPANRSWGASKEQLEEWWEQGLILKKKDGSPRMDGLKVYMDDLKGKALIDWWDDIPRVGNTSSESLGYPTQKPELLLERIINASTQKGDLVADFFCGCGTTIASAQGLNRRWLGVDISHLAVGLMQRRIIKRYGKAVADTFEIDGLPKDVASAKQLALVPKGRMKFQDWIIETMLGGIHNPKKTADGGWDGHLTFETDFAKEIVIIEVKSGHVNVKNLREFIQVVDKQNAAIGIFVCFEEEITMPMELEAKDAGYYAKEYFGNKYDKIQIMSVERLIAKDQIDIPESKKQTFKIAKKSSRKDSSQNKLNF